MHEGGRAGRSRENEMGMATLFLKNTPGNYEQQLISYFPGCGKRARKKRGGHQVERKKERTGEEGKGRKGWKGGGRLLRAHECTSDRVRTPESWDAMANASQARDRMGKGRSGKARQGRQKP